MSALFSSETILFGTDFDAETWPQNHALSANSDRKLLIFLHREQDAPARAVTSIDVGGNAATKLTKAAATGGEFREDTDCWWYDVPAGASGNIGITPTLDGASNNDVIIRVVEAYAAKAGAPTIFDGVFSNTPNMAFSLPSCPAGSLAVVSGVCNGGFISGADAWSFGVGNPDGFTFLAEQCSLGTYGNASSGCHSGGGYKAISALSSESFSMTADATAEDKTGVAVCIEEAVVASGSVADSSVTLDGATVSSTASQPAAASSADVSATLDDATVTAIGSQNLVSSSADVAVTLGDASVSSDAGWGAYAGVHTTTDDAVVVSVAESVFSPALGDLSVTLDDALLVSVGANNLIAIGDLAVQLEDAGVSSEATSVIPAAAEADASVSLDDAGLVSSGGASYVPETGDLNVTLDDAAVSSTATQNTTSTAYLGVTLDDVVFGSTATIASPDGFGVVTVTTDDAIVVSEAEMVLSFDSDISVARTAVVTTLGIRNNVHSKDPEGTLDYGVNWAEWLDDVSDSIVVSEWLASDDFSVHQSGESNGISSIWISGGVEDKAYSLVNRIRTNGGRVYDCTLYLRCKSQ